MPKESNRFPTGAIDGNRCFRWTEGPSIGKPIPSPNQPSKVGLTARPGLDICSHPNDRYTSFQVAGPERRSTLGTIVGSSFTTVGLNTADIVARARCIRKRIPGFRLSTPGSQHPVKATAVTGILDGYTSLAAMMVAPSGTIPGPLPMMLSNRRSACELLVAESKSTKIPSSELPSGFIVVGFD